MPAAATRAAHSDRCRDSSVCNPDTAVEVSRIAALRSSATAVTRRDAPVNRLEASPNPAGRFRRCVPRSYTAAPSLTNAPPSVEAAFRLCAQALSNSPPARPSAPPAADTTPGSALPTRAASASGFTPARATRVA